MNAVPFAPTPTPDPTVSVPSRRRSQSIRGLGWTVGLLVFAVLGGWLWSDTLPPVTGSLRLVVTFPRGAAGQNEPLVTTGSFANGDFLTVKYTDAATALLSYDAWGKGGPDSPAFALQPGTPHRVEVNLPSLAAQPAPRKGEQRLLTVTLDGREMLHEPVGFHGRRADELYVAVNPIGGSPAQAFGGRITSESGARVRGRPAALFTSAQRIAAIYNTRGWQVLALLAVSATLGLIVAQLPLRRWLQALRATPGVVFAGRTTAPRATFLVVAAACVLVFTTLITGGTFTLLYPESFGSFYDYQAASLLEGRLDVPEAALSGEAFVVQGKVYGYFGVAPALLRLPFAVTHVAFAQLSRGYMIADYAACLAASYFLLCWATRRLGGGGAWPSRWAVAVLVGGTGLGSTLLFLGSRAYIYHEAILCGAAFALWGAYFTLRYFEQPERRWWLAAVACGGFAVHARPPAGLFSLFLLGCAALYHLLAAWRAGQPRRMIAPLAVGTSAAVAMASFSGMSYLKFGTFDGSPLRYSVQYTPERVARFEGKNFHLSNLGHNVNTYLLAPDFRLERRFPYVFFGSGHQRSFPEARIDLEENTVALPYAMAGLFGLALVGGAWACVIARSLRGPVLLLAVGLVPMAAALCTAIVTSHRYTGDFCAPLIALAACGVAGFDTWQSRWRRIALASATVLSVVAVAITVGVSLQFQGEVVWGVGPEAQQHYRAWRDRADRLFGVKHP